MYALMHDTNLSALKVESTVITAACIDSSRHRTVTPGKMYGIISDLQGWMTSREHRILAPLRGTWTCAAGWPSQHDPWPQ